MNNRIISTTGTTEPVTLAEAKNYLRINNTADDDLITAMIVNARLQAENYIDSDIVTKQREAYVFSVDEPINLQYAPIATIDSVTIRGEAATENERYRVQGSPDPYITFGTGASDINGNFGSFPENDITITYTTAGVSNNSIKQGVLCLVAWLYYGRTAEMMTNWKTWLTPFRRYGFYGQR